MKLHNVLTSLTLAGSLCTLTGQAYADGINFDSNPNNIQIFSTDFAGAEAVRTVNVVCPQNGFLLAMAGTEFDVVTASPKDVRITYGILSSANGVPRISPQYDILVGNTGSRFLAASPLMRVDPCKGGTLVTYQFRVSKGSANALDNVTAFQPRLVVTFYQNKI